MYLGAPEFHGPVERGRDKEVGKVDGAHRAVTADACDGPLVALKHLTDTCLTGEGKRTRQHLELRPLAQNSLQKRENFICNHILSFKLLKCNLI